MNLFIPVITNVTLFRQLTLDYMAFFESLIGMMGRIGDHLDYLATYATGIAFQNSEKMQGVRLIISILPLLYRE